MDDDDPYDSRQYSEGRRMARRVLGPGGPAVKDIEVWVHDHLSRGTMGPTRAWRQGYVDEARSMFYERLGKPRDN